MCNSLTVLSSSMELGGEDWGLSVCNSGHMIGIFWLSTELRPKLIVCSSLLCSKDRNASVVLSSKVQGYRLKPENILGLFQIIPNLKRIRSRIMHWILSAYPVHALISFGLCKCGQS